MGSCTINSRNIQGALRKVRLILEAVKIEQSLFALPFAYIGMMLAAQGLPPLMPFIWITIAMVGARNAGMAFNRVLDRKMDKLNPRTANRHIPLGLLKPHELSILGIIGLGALFLAAAQLNSLSLYLSPLAGIAVIGYSLVKRFSWLTSISLGLTLAIAPVGGWIGVTGSLSWEPLLLAAIVATFAGGFDIFNTCPDMKFDQAQGIHSIPARFGLPAAFRVARGLHILTSASILALGLLLGLSWPYYIGWATATALLIYEHWVLSPNDMSKLAFVFSRVNAAISIAVFVGVFTALLIQ